AFATPDTAWLLPSVLLHLPHRELGRYHLSNFPAWREPSRAHLVEAMHIVHEDPDRLRPLRENARRVVASRLTWDHGARALLCPARWTRSRGPCRAPPAPPHGRPASGSIMAGRWPTAASSTVLRKPSMPRSGRQPPAAPAARSPRRRSPVSVRSPRLAAFPKTRTSFIASPSPRRRRIRTCASIWRVSRTPLVTATRQSASGRACSPAPAPAWRRRPPTV